jgi:IS5 family transposase
LFPQLCLTCRVVDGEGIPLGAIAAPANRHDSPLLVETLDAVMQTLGGLPEGTNIHLDRGYDSESTRQRLRERALLAQRSPGRESLPRSVQPIGGS